MQRTVSLKRCSLAIALAAAVLMLPAASDAQLGGILPAPAPIPIPTLTPPTGSASSVTGSASAMSATLLGMTTALRFDRHAQRS